MKKIRCPYCLELVQPRRGKIKNRNVYTCPNKECKEEIHRDYVEKGNIPKMTMGLVGFTGHGKTCYLTSLFYLFKYLRSEKGMFLWDALDGNTEDIMFKHVEKFVKDSQLPKSTPENFPKPALICISDIPFFGDYFSRFYDTAGRVYEEAEKITDMGRFVAYCEIVFFVISIKDCGKDWKEIANKMERLLDIYWRGVYDKLHIDLKDNQHLIVVLTKADEVREIPDELKKFLEEGSYDWYLPKNPQSEKGFVRYKLRLLQEKSMIIKKWLEEKKCKGFTNLAQKRFKSVEYTIVSSLGASPVGGMLAKRLEPEDPKRVLDPFLLALKKTRPKGIWEKIFGGD